MFINACREWRWRPENEKTWTNFKTHFAQAHTELGELTHTSQAGGYHNANNAFTNFATNPSKALANLATATAADRDMLRSLQATNAALIQQNTVKDAEIAQLCNQVQQLQAGISNCGNNNNTNDNRCTNNSGRNNNNNNNQNNSQNNNQNNNQTTTKTTAHPELTSMAVTTAATVATPMKAINMEPRVTTPWAAVKPTCNAPPTDNWGRQ
jgi:hypothetical protein